MKDVLEAHGLVLSPRFRNFFKINQFSSKHSQDLSKCVSRFIKLLYILPLSFSLAYIQSYICKVKSKQFNVITRHEINIDVHDRTIL